MSETSGIPSGTEVSGTESPGAEVSASPESSNAAVYRVLARKYRPADFTTLIGQQALVRTLSNAIRTGRLAQAYMLTGVRGVGKTTTARIIARCLNCVGPDGSGGPTVEPCGVCDQCRAIAEDRHVDVFEMDAASRTGVNDIRELIEGVRYRPTSARYKIYIIDEVHMLSTGAFNALLKTLEEPPEHVKFIFATTEIRKVPVTVLSRCQRFDLRRVTTETLAEHFGRIAAAEQARIEPAALQLLARAADGSVRDGLSLLDQAIAQAGAAGEDGETIGESLIRDMLGLADRALVFDLFDAVMRGDVATALTLLADQYAAGADPVVVLNDMLELTHWLTRLKVTPESASDPMVAETERTRGQDMSGRLSVAVLTRTWQMLLKGVGEARSANSPLQAVEMVLIRLAYSSSLPTPAEAIARLAGSPAAGAVMPGSPPPSPPGSHTPAGSSFAGPASGSVSGPVSGQASGGSNVSRSGGSAALAPQETAPWEPQASASPRQPAPPTFDAMVALFQQHKEALLAYHLERNVHLVRYDARTARLEFRPAAKAPADLAGQTGKMLSQWTGQRWGVTVSNEPGEATLFERTMTGARANPLVQAVLLAFPKASIGVVRDLEPAAAPSFPEAAPMSDAEIDEAAGAGYDDLIYGDFEP